MMCPFIVSLISFLIAHSSSYWLLYIIGCQHHGNQVPKQLALHVKEHCSQRELPWAWSAAADCTWVICSYFFHFCSGLLQVWSLESSICFMMAEMIGLFFVLPQRDPKILCWFNRINRNLGLATSYRCNVNSLKRTSQLTLQIAPTCIGQNTFRK